MAQSISIIPGSTIHERFHLIRPLGKGSMGSVWLARHLSLDIDVALKFIDSSLTKEGDYVERFQREARAAAQLKSPHVVQVLDYGADERGRPFMAMEYLDGMTLGKMIEKRGCLDLESTTRFISHAARGLAKAHTAGIVHRDIKPENLFLCGDKEEEGFVLKVLDFGVARAGFTPAEQGTLAGQLVGSPVFMSPEQARGQRTIDHRADLFSLAVVAYQCLTGSLPFDGDGLGEVLVSICTADPAPPSLLCPELPPSVDAWFEKALAKKPHARFESAREMSHALAAAVGSKSSSGVDLTASFARVSWSDLGAGDPAGALQPANTARTAVPSSTAPFSPRTGSLSASRVQPTSIADALNPLTSVPHLRGVALLDHNDDCLLMRGQLGDAQIYANVALYARTVGDTVESIEGAQEPTHLSVRFDNSSVYVRWVGPFMLIAVGDAQMRALLLTVGSNRLAERLEAFTSQLGGVESAASSLRDSGVGLPVRPPERPKNAGLPSPAPRDRTLLSKGPPLPPPQRRGQDLRASAPAGPPPAPSVRAAAAAAEAHLPTLESEPQKRSRVMVYRGKVVGGSKEAEPEPKTRKKVLVYRGKVIK